MRNSLSSAMVRKSFWIFILVLLKTPLTWGFSLERTANYLQEAAHLHLSADPQWLRLGHYHKTLLHQERSKIRGSFFLSPEGSQNPEAELMATLQSLFSGDGKTQCKYLARTQWLKQKLSLDPQDLLPCEERQAWKKSLNAQAGYLIFASNDLNSAASSFGHTFIRLHNPKNSEGLDLIDYGVNFAAATGENDGVLFALKGLFGMYPGAYSMMPYHQKLRDYINLEGRDIWEYRMNLSPAEVEMLVNHLLELEDSYVPYYFLDDNCSYQILELIEVLKPDMDLTSHFIDVTIPLDSLKILASQKDFLSAGKKRPSLQSEFEADYKKLNRAQKNEIDEISQSLRDPSQLKQTIEGIQKLPPLEEKILFDTALSYLAVKEYRDQILYKEGRYQLSLARAQLGRPSEKNVPPTSSPLASLPSAALQVGVGMSDHQSLGLFKIRRAFHDLLSRDEGVSPFSHLEALSAQFKYFAQAHRLDLDQAQILKIISTRPVTALDHPFSWKTSLGTAPKLNPYFEPGLGYSFDFDWGQGARWTTLAVARIGEDDQRGQIGGGVESFFLQKITESWRSLQLVRYLGLTHSVGCLEGEFAFSHDLSSQLEARLSYQRERGQDIYLFSLIF